MRLHLAVVEEGQRMYSELGPGPNEEPEVDPRIPLMDLRERILRDLGLPVPLDRIPRPAVRLTFGQKLCQNTVTGAFHVADVSWGCGENGRVVEWGPRSKPDSWDLFGEEYVRR